MKNLIIALSLTVASSASFANGFSPWEERGVAPTAQDAYAATVENTGFAPWRVVGGNDTFANEEGIAMDIEENNIFRPWS
ncbi:MAG: hypothetical protein AAF387_00390 [Pseudomonadota bacterium]